MADGEVVDGEVSPAIPRVPEALGMEALLATLAEEERILLSLHYLRGQSSAEIAATLGVPERAVQTILRQGKARLMGGLGIY